MKSIDLNADLGEGMGFDKELLEIISSASIACGGHAGDDETMAKTLTAAKKANVVTGAHPGFEDRKNFGRKQLDISASQMGEITVEQIKTICTIADEVGQKISYVKLHGALYNLASKDFAYAKTIFSAIKKFDKSLAILAMDNSAQLRAAKELGFKTIHEAFADRAYQKNGLLLSRKFDGAVFDRVEMAVDQVLSIAQNNKITSYDGFEISSSANSICLHGDNKAALKLANAIKLALENAGIKIAAPVLNQD
ncbi:Lactam utilization protein LamB [hydrothermal vent metagenome]|uniref:Lactam utilization protein LamB n=1 Tax=hydrothermal vent metagenome TaxID=652676 RepID=A0A3B0U002_9ZZZZ